MPINTYQTMSLDDFNADFDAKVQWLIDNLQWNSDLDAADKARFATALALNNYNVHIFDDNGDVIKIQNP